MKIKSCPAFTLIEAVTAIIIVLMCFWLSGMIYINIIRADARGERLRAFTEIRRVAAETNQRRTFYDEKIVVDSTLQIQKTIEPYQSEPELKILNIEASNAKGRKTAVYKQIIMTK